MRGGLPFIIYIIYFKWWFSGVGPRLLCQVMVSRNGLTFTLSIDAFKWWALFYTIIMMVSRSGPPLPCQYTMCARGGPFFECRLMLSSGGPPPMKYKLIVLRGRPPTYVQGVWILGSYKVTNFMLKCFKIMASKSGFLWKLSYCSYSKW